MQSVWCAFRREDVRILQRKNEATRRDSAFFRFPFHVYLRSCSGSNLQLKFWWRSFVSLCGVLSVDRLRANLNTWMNQHLTTCQSGLIDLAVGVLRTSVVRGSCASRAHEIFMICEDTLLVHSMWEHSNINDVMDWRGLMWMVSMSALCRRRVSLICSLGPTLVDLFTSVDLRPPQHKNRQHPHLMVAPMFPSSWLRCEQNGKSISKWYTGARQTKLSLLCLRRCRAAGGTCGRHECSTLPDSQSVWVLCSVHAQVKSYICHCEDCGNVEIELRPRKCPRASIEPWDFYPSVGRDGQTLMRSCCPMPFGITSSIHCVQSSRYPCGREFVSMRQSVHLTIKFTKTRALALLTAT